MALYKVVLKGACQGQAVNNILYYRNSPGTDVGGITLGGTQEVAEAVKAIVWPALRIQMNQLYTLNQIDSYVYNDQTFELLYNQPYSTGVQQAGLYGSTDMDGPARCAILKFVLEAAPLLVDGPKPPKRGYLAIGPLVSGQINQDGSLNLTPPENIAWDAICAVLANNVETILPVPAVFFPVRVHMDKVGILFRLKITSFSDVKAALMRRQTSFRRSRMPES